MLIGSFGLPKVKFCFSGTQAFSRNDPSLVSFMSVVLSNVKAIFKAYLILFVQELFRHGLHFILSQHFTDVVSKQSFNFDANT